MSLTKPEMVFKTIPFLLRVREEMLRGRLLIYVGEERIERLLSLAEGYHACLCSNGSSDEAYARFTQWLRETQQASSLPTWPVETLQGSPDEHKKAIRRYLDLVLQFAASHESGRGLRLSQKGTPEAIKPHVGCVGTLEVLLQIHQEMVRGQIPTLGAASNAEWFETFVEGCHCCLIDNGCMDERYEHFFEWLRDVRQELPGEGWPAKYLWDCHGDHRQAVRKYLDFVAEFAALEAT